CVEAGLVHFSTEGLYGYIRGFAVDQVGDARAALQQLMIRYGFDAVERGGMLRFRSRTGREAVTLDPHLLARSNELDGTVEQVREAEAEVTGRVRVRFLQADADFDVIAEEAVLADEATHAVTASELTMTMTRGEGRQVAERWLTEARVSREQVKLALPPSQWGLGAGDVIELPGDGAEGPGRYRIDRVEQTEVQLVEAVRIEPQVYDLADIHEEPVARKAFVAPMPVTALFLDLPLLRGDEVPHAPHVAAGADPWPGSVALYQSSEDANYRLNGLVQGPAAMGRTQSALARACAGLMDRGSGVVVRMRHGELSSISHEALLSGGNLAAIGDGSVGGWEVIQFAQAELVAPQTWWLSDLIRGQGGSDALTPAVWPEGSEFVLLNGAVGQIDYSPALRRVPQHFRIGPGQRPLDDPAYRHRVVTVSGNGARPLSPCHLRQRRLEGGERRFSWIRRTRIEGDSWEVPEVPLGEESETYLVRVYQAGILRREILVSSQDWTYEAADQAADGVSAPFDVAVAQVSASYGAGSAQVIRIEA
ncbi:MAG: phage tail protein, partial [Sulfitobacter sp.]|nr:phage tail protein [Sulfitobacter sp.]